MSERGWLDPVVTRRTLLLGAAAVGGSLAASACGFGSTSAPPEKDSGPLTVRFSTVSSGATGFLTHVMVQRKIDAKHGLRLDVTASDPSAAEKAVLLKKVDAGLYPLISAARANNEGQPITIFGPILWSHNYGLTYADRQYSGFKDLKGKRIATLDQISATYQATQLLAAEEGIDLEKDVHVVTSPAPAVLAILERRDVDAIVQFEPNIGNLLTTGKYRVFIDFNAEWNRLHGQNMLSVGIAAHEGWIKDNGEASRRLVKASLEAAEVIHKDPSVFQDYAEFLGLNSAEKIKAAQERMPKIYPTVWNKAMIDGAEVIVRRAAELKMIDRLPSRQIAVLL